MYSFKCRISSQRRVILAETQQHFIKFCPFKIAERYGILEKKADTVQNRLFLSAVNKRYRPFYGLSKYSKRSVTMPGHCGKVRFIPAVFIMIAGKIHAQRIFGIG